MKKLIFLCLGCILCTSCTILKDSSLEDNLVPIEIIEMNDIHGHIEDEGKYGGLARANTLIQDIRNETKEDNTVLIGNGDMLQETAISRVSYGRVVIDAMTQMKFDMMGVGNHEFDWGFEKILAYFDGNKENGEAGFPLVNSNIYYEDNLIEKDNTVSKLLVEKENVKVGMVSYIGNLASSINANMLEGYTFKAQASDIAQSVSTLGIELKLLGADIIIVNIHGGEASSCIDYEVNNLLAQLKYGDSYLVDAVINGHTHTLQEALIKREAGASLPIIQSSGKLEAFGRIDLKYDVEKKQVIEVSTSHVYTSTSRISDPKVDTIIEKHYLASKPILEEVYCKNEQYINRYDQKFQEYALRVMMAATNATAACCNTGAFRNNVAAGDFDFKALYALNPFDNHIILCEISGLNLKRFYDANSNYEMVFTRDFGSSIAVDQTYTLAIVDYVYFGNYFAGYRTSEFTDTNLIVRDLLMEDLRLRKNEGFKLSRDYQNVLISPTV